MGLFDRVRQAFRGKQVSGQSDQQVETTAAPKMPEISLSPLPKSISGMPKGQHIDRLGMMHATDIGFGPGFGPDQQGFWEYKEQRTGGHSKADYLEMASHIPEVRERLNNGESLESLMQDSRVGACATQYFPPGNMIQVESHPDGHYEYSTGGRHRIAAAQELEIEIPVQINEYGRKGDYSILPWEKQERYDALMDYMQKHGYSEADRATYEADPEWQRLHSEFDHPVNEGEKPELSDWEREADALLEKRYQDLHASKDTPPETKSNGGLSDDGFDDGPPPPPPGGGGHNDNPLPPPPPGGGNDPTSRFSNNGSSQSAKDSKVDEKADIPSSADAHVDASTSTDSGAVADMTGMGSQSSVQAAPITPSATSSVSLGDRYQSSYADRIRQTPSLESNRWAGERGESVCTPQSDVARQIMEERGISGVQYQDGVPDFSPFSESTVKLGYMTDARHSQGLTAGRDGKDTIYAHFEDDETVSESHHADKSSMADLHMKYDKPGNFEQADALTAEQWTADGRDGKEWTAEDVAQYRQDHGLTWHECNDMETMQMIPEAINADFGHLGGVGEVKETQRIVDEALRDYDEGQMVEAEDYDRMTPEELEAAAREHGHYTDDGVWAPDERSVEPVEEKIDQGIPDEQAVEDSNPDSDEGYLKVEHDEEIGTRIDDIAAQTEGDDLPDNNTSLTEETFDDIKDAIPDESKETGVSGEQAVDQMETAASDANMEQATQGFQENTSDASVEDAVPDGQTLDHIEDVVNPDDAEQATQDLQEATPDTSAEETGIDEQAVDQMESAILSEEMDQPEQATQELQGNMPEASAEDAATEAHADDQMEAATLADDIDQSSDQEVQDSIPDTSAESAVSDEQTAEQIEDAVLSDDVGQTEEVAQELRENTPDASAGDTMTDEQSVDQMEAANPDDDVTQPEQTAQELQDGTPDNSAEGPVSDDQAVDQMNGSVADDDMDQVEETSQELQEDTPDSSIPDDGGDLLEQAAREQGAEEQAAQETAEQEAEEQAAQEAVEQETKEQAAQEAIEQEADEQGAQELTEQDVEEQTAQEAAEQEAEEQAAQEAAEQEAEEQAAQEAAEQEAEEQAAQETAEQEAEEQAAQEAAEQEAYDEFADEQAEEEFTDAEEDYSNLADEPIEESYDDSDYSDLADETAEDYVDDSADYSDMVDDIDSGPYDDSSFDSSDATFDSGDTGSFDGGGDSIE